VLDINKDKAKFVNRELRKLGWIIVRVWECELKDASKVAVKLKKHVSWAGKGNPYMGVFLSLEECIRTAQIYTVSIQDLYRHTPCGRRNFAIRTTPIYGVSIFRV
jgi:hypothetical protein